jgi:hypothetical protein
VLMKSQNTKRVGTRMWKSDQLMREETAGGDGDGHARNGGGKKYVWYTSIARRSVDDSCRGLNTPENTTHSSLSNMGHRAHVDVSGWVNCLLHTAQAHVHMVEWTEGVLDTITPSGRAVVHM